MFAHRAVIKETFKFITPYGTELQSMKTTHQLLMNTFSCRYSQTWTFTH